MIYKHKINSLSEEELSVIVFLMTHLTNSKIKFDISILPFYKLAFVQHLLKIGWPNVKDEHKDYYKELCVKFELEI